MDRHRSFVDKGPRSMRRPQQLLSWFLFSLTLAMIASLGMSKGAFAAAPPAGTPIGNAATATYTDNTGAERNATSNTVITTVNQVDALDLQDDRNLEAGPGSPVYFPHAVTNTGNGDDTYTLTAVDASSGTALENIQIFADANVDGMPDNFTVITETPELAAGESFSFVVAGKVPDAATSLTVFNVDVTATSQSTVSLFAVNNDAVTVTDRAVVNVTKSIDTSTATSPSGTVITYTLTYYNNGKADATDLVITDTLDSRLTYVPGSGLWSQRTTALADSGLPQAGNGTATIDFEATANSVVATISDVPFNTSGQSGSSGWISFDVNVNPNVLPGEIPNHAVFGYDDGTSTVADSNTNIVNLTVLPTVAVSGTGDVQGTPANQGDTIYFNNLFRNEGNGIDTFNVTYENTTFPAGTTFALYNGDATGPSSLLQDTNGDAVPDTGQLAPNPDGTNPAGDANIWLQVTLPPYYSGATVLEATKTATSVTNPNVSTTVTDSIPSVTASVVDLISDNANNLNGNGSGQGPEAASIELQAGDPGSTVTYTMQMQNNSALPDNFDLLASGDGTTWVQIPALPAGATVVFKNTNGAVITNTGVIAASGFVNYTAEVTIPAGAAPITDSPIYFRAQSPNTGAFDIIRNGLTVHTYEDVTIEPNHTGQTYPGNSIVYVHTVTNNSNVAKVVTLSTTNSGSAQGFTSLLYQDGTGLNADGVLTEADGTPITSITLAPGASQIIFTKVFASAGATPGNMDVSTVSGTYDVGNLPNPSPNSGDGTLSATDTTTVVLGQLTLEKRQALSSDTGDSSLVLTNLQQDPGEGIWYRIQVTNNGTAPISDVVVTDVVPAFTTIQNGVNPSGQYEYGEGVSWRLGTATSYTVGSPTVTAPATGNTGILTFNLSAGLTGGELLPGQTAYIYYSVQINN